MAVAAFPIIGVHLDLKYIMPRKDYLRAWVRELPGYGINTLLIEYEDKFPYQRHPVIRSADAFSPVELREFLATCRGVGLRVVPLIQTFSHLEFALAHQPMQPLRELPHIHTQINPQNPAAVRFVEDLIDEVLAFHGEDEFFHLGADEAWHMGHHPDNAAFLAELGPVGYWSRHMRPLIERVRQAGKRAMIWDDIFWKDPQSLVAIDLPQDTLLVSWQYTTTQLKPDRSTFKRVDAYRAAGYEVVGAPCLNWGVLTPRHEHCLANTATWAEKARQSDLQGLINTGWGGFHVFPHTQALYIAATAQSLAGGRAAMGDDWQEAFLGDYFGACTAGVGRALEQVGQLWEQEVGLERPITPILYGYMDLILHYPNGHADRRSRGNYPHDWDELDTDALFDRKLRLLAEKVDPSEVASRLGRLQQEFAEAAAVLDDLAGRTQHHRAEAQYLAMAGRIKALHAQVLEHLLTGRRDRSSLRQQWQEVGSALRQALMPFIDARGIVQLERLWWRPTAKSLGLL